MKDALRGRAKLAGRVIVGGTQSRERFAECLGLQGSPLGRVSAAAWRDHALELGVTGREGRTWALRFEQRTPESKGLVTTRALNVYFRGSDVDPELVEHVAKRAPARLATLDLDDLAEAIAADPELGAAEHAMPPSADTLARPASLLDSWGAGDAFADFFATGEVARSQLDSIDPSRLFRFVQHCDSECLQVSPHTVVPTVSLVNFPWDDRRRNDAARLGSEAGTLDHELAVDGMITTDLDENDVIMGSRAKLKRVLDLAVSREDPDGRPLFFSNTCVPAVIGEDVQSLVRRAAERSGKRIFYLTVSARSMTTVFQEFFVDRRLAAERTAGPPSPRSVNLIGFPDSRAVDELSTLLEERGVSVNARFLPEVRVELLERLPLAEVNVLYPNSTWQHHYDSLTAPSRLRTIAPDAPFGMSGTDRWLRAVAAAVGATDEPSRVNEDVLDSWTALRARAAHHSLGVVVRDREAFHLTTPSRNWGVPLLRLLEEMGFGLDVLVGVSERATANAAAREVRALFAEPRRHSILAFDGFPLLRQRLETSRARAFFSYHFFDWRLTSAGKAMYSLQHLEMGRAGALRSLRRLLRLCERGFYARYARFLSRTDEGLRREWPA